MQFLKTLLYILHIPKILNVGDVKVEVDEEEILGECIGLGF